MPGWEDLAFFSGRTRMGQGNGPLWRLGTQGEDCGTTQLVVRPGSAHRERKVNGRCLLLGLGHSNFILKVSWKERADPAGKTSAWGRARRIAGESYTPFEQQILAAYWALTETQQLTVGHDVLLQPGIPTVKCILSAPVSHKIGHAQEASNLKENSIPQSSPGHRRWE